MKRQLDLRSGRVLVALGTLGLGGGYATSAAVSPPAQAGVAGEHQTRSSDTAGDPRGAVVFTDSVGEAAVAHFQRYLKISAMSFKVGAIGLLRMSFVRRP